MGIDYLVCGSCGDPFPDVVDYGVCGACEETFCEYCFPKMGEKYGVLGEDHEDVELFGEDAPVKCDVCMAPTLDKAKFETLMYFLIKDAAKYSFDEFLEEAELTEEDYDGIKAYLENEYGIKLYL